MTACASGLAATGGSSKAPVLNPELARASEDGVLDGAHGFRRRRTRTGQERDLQRAGIKCRVTHDDGRAVGAVAARRRAVAGHDHAREGVGGFDRKEAQDFEGSVPDVLVDLERRIRVVDVGKEVPDGLPALLLGGGNRRPAAGLALVRAATGQDHCNDRQQRGESTRSHSLAIHAERGALPPDPKHE